MLELSASSTWAEYDEVDGADDGHCVGVAGDTPGPGADDEDADGCAVSITHADGATIQSMNSQAAAMRVTSSRTVVMPWANK